MSEYCSLHYRSNTTRRPGTRFWVRSVQSDIDNSIGRVVASCLDDRADSTADHVGRLPFEQGVVCRLVQLGSVIDAARAKLTAALERPATDSPSAPACW